MSKSNRQWTKKVNAGPSSHKGGPSSSADTTPSAPATAISITTGSEASIALSAGATAAAAAVASAAALSSSSSSVIPPSSGKNEVVSSLTSSLSSLSLSSPSSASASSNQSESGESSVSDSDKQFILRKGDLAAPLTKGGTIGSKLSIKANFFPIQLKLKQLYIYAVDFEPAIGLELAAKRKREISRFYSIIDRAFARQHSFNGHTINSMKEIVVDSLLPLVQENENTPNALFVESVTNKSFRIRLNDKSGSQISAVTIHYERTVTPDDMNSSEISHITATFVRAILTRRLQLLNLQNAYFDPKQVHQIQQYRFQLMMGYQAVVNACHQRQALIVDVVHKIYQPTTLDKLVVEKLEALKKGASTTPALFNQLISNKQTWEEAMDEYRGRRMIYSNKISKRVVRCDFIDFEMHLDTVMDKSKDNKLTYRQYFNDKYKIKLLQQFPGLVCEFRMRPSKAWKLIEQGKKVDGTYYPLELCNPTGSLDRDRADFRMLKAIADVSRKPPNVKLDLINKFTALLSTINNTNNNNASASSSSSSSSSSSPVANKRPNIADMATENLSIEAKMMETQARILPGPRIIAGSNIFLIDGDNPKKNMQVQQGVMKQSLLNTSGKAYQLPSSKPYGVIYSLEDEKNEICKWFLEEFQKEVGRMKIKLPTQSKLFGVAAGGPAVWQTKANEIVSKEAANLSFVIVILPFKNTDLIYSMLKTIFIQGGIIHSCIKADSIDRTYNGKLKGAIPSYAFQLFIKQGALQWCVEPAPSIQPHVPLHPALQAARFGGSPNTMIVAADVSHDAKAKTVWNPPASSSSSSGSSGSLFSASVSSSLRQKVDTVGFVATYDANFTQYHSFVGTQTSGKLGSDLIQRSDEYMKGACELFKQKNNNKYPENIIVYRDGVGESQIASFVYQEMIKYQSAFNELKIKPKLTVIVVQKRVGARFFTNNGGTAPPGTVIDSGITSSGRREFYLVNCETPPNANAVPTRYIIVQDDNNFSMDQIELFTHHLSYGFSNWRGPIKIPAPVKCADNLSRLFGRFIRNANNNNVHQTIASTTYFL